MMTIEENLKIATMKLKKSKIEEPRKIARLLLCSVLKIRKEEVLLYEKKELAKQEEEEYQKSIQKLEEGYPLQYITHHQEFMKLDFYVDEHVLIPRADTEITVEEVISYCQNQGKGNLRILDLCTGSGAIAISLGRYLPNCEIVAVDISKEALKVAKKNAKQNEVNNITCIQSNLFENVVGTFDVIVSNPPYIKTKVIATLEPEVQKEPIIALDGGIDGLIFYQKILKQAGNYFKKDGAIFFEIGYDQKEEVMNMIRETKEYREIEGKKDLSGNDRMIMAKRG